MSAAEDIVLDAEMRMDKAVEVFKSSLAGIRTGRANPGLVDSLRVEAYGSPTPMKQIASVGAPEPTQIVIRPYDPGTIKDIEKAIIAGNLGFTPQNDGRLIRINIPPLSGRGPAEDGDPHQGSGGRKPKFPSVTFAATPTKPPIKLKKKKRSAKTNATI